MKGSLICQLRGVWQDYMTMLEVIVDKVCSPGKFSFKKYLQVANFSSFHGQTQESMNSICICSCRDTKGLLSMKIRIWKWSMFLFMKNLVSKYFTISIRIDSHLNKLYKNKNKNLPLLQARIYQAQCGSWWFR